MNKRHRPPVRRRRKKHILPLLMGALILSCWAVYLATGSIAAGEKKPSSSAPDSAPVSKSDIIIPESGPILPLSSAPEQPQQSEPPKKEESSTAPSVPAEEPVSLSDLLFIGDSRTEGLMLYGGIGEANFFYQTGLSVSTALKKEFVRLNDGSDGTLEQGLSERSFQRIYLMFGVNELGWPDTASFIAQYRKVVALVQQKQPDAEIVVQSIIPVTAQKSQGDKTYNNDNIQKFNSAIQAMAQEDGLTYLDLTSTLTDETGCLPEDASVDGVHLKKSYCEKWAARIRESAGL